MNTTPRRPAPLLRWGAAALGAMVVAVSLASTIGNTTGAFDPESDLLWAGLFWVALTVGGVLLFVAAVLLGHAWGRARGGAAAPVVALLATAAATCLLVTSAFLASVELEPTTSTPAPWVQATSSLVAIALLACIAAAIAGTAIAVSRNPDHTRASNR